MQEVNFLQSLHQSTKRDYLARMNVEKPECMRVAKEFGKDYWDGDRKYGYGGYKYDGRWKPVAEAIVDHYGLKQDNYICDIGCGKGYLLTEFAAMDIGVYGIDVSTYAICDAELSALREALNEDTRFEIHPATKIPTSNECFDFTYSINVFHNLGYKDLKQAIKEMVRVTKPDGNSYICVESYRNEEELTNLQAWQLTCLSYYSPDDWKEILTDNGYKGDVEFIYFT